MAESGVRMDRRQILRYGGAAAGALLAESTILQSGEALAHSRAAVAPASPVDWNAVAAAVGGPGQMKGDGVFVVELSRSDLKATAFGVPVQPDLAMDGEAAFMQMGSTTMVMGELALLQKEAIAVWRGLLANEFSVSALHNHLLEISPQIMFIHFDGKGDAMRLARGLRAALAGSKTPATTSSPKKLPAIDNKGIERVFGMAGEAGDQVFYLEVPRAETITMHGMALPSAMGVQSYIYFQAAGDGRAATQAELALRAGEIAAVSRSLQAHGLIVTALHNHMSSIQPMLFWMHVWGIGDAVTVAKGLRAALDHTNSKR